MSEGVTTEVKEVAFFGPTGGCALAALKLALESGYRCSALTRRPSHLLSQFSTLPPKTLENLTIVEGSVQTPSAVAETLRSQAHPERARKYIISGIGGALKFGLNPFRPSLDNPHVCEEAAEAVLSCLRELKSAVPEGGEWQQPLLAVISSTGLAPGELPFVMRPAYKMLKIPLEDKIKMEGVVTGAEEGLVKWVVVRAGLLTDGPAGGAVRAGYAGRVKSGSGKWGDVEGVAVGYKISRGDVGRWLFAEVIGQDGGEWVGKKVCLVY
ncbi:hypothetical protein L873DRAFT_207056 [Choiromyces venosus 120613-1]|uniref:Uncharacterized protein n=1 Tax=Choiromyces venosus 120613-1 TaxID=1336337 RepID=A0A3N4J235_9PEZI|nr:hypothetical protein L873DRAFT_207056 [Choiromyces venosus 120613-1]